MKNIDNKLEKIKSAQFPEFPLSDLQVRTLLDSVDSTNAGYYKPTKGLFKMTAITSIIITAVLSLFYFANNPNNDLEQAVPQTKNIVAKSVATVPDNISISSYNDVLSTNTLQANNHLPIAETITKIDEIIEGSSSISESEQTEQVESQATKDEIPFSPIVELNATSDIDLATNELSENKPSSKETLSSYYYDISDEGTAAKDKDTIEILVLTDDELAKLFINKVDCGYTYIDEPSYPANHDKEKMAELQRLGYPKKGYKRAVRAITLERIDEVRTLKYEGWDMKKTSGIFPIKSNLLQYQAGYENPGRIISQGSINPSDGSRHIYNNDFSSNIHKILTPISRKDISNSIKVAYNKRSGKALKCIVPILLKLQKDSTIALVVLTFPKSQNLIDLLPKRYNIQPDVSEFEGIGGSPDLASISYSYNEFLSSNSDICSGVNDERMSAKPTFSTQVNPIGGVERLLLTNEEAAKIGMVIDSDSIYLSTEDWIDLSDIPKRALDYINGVFSYPTDGFTLIKNNVSISLVYSGNEEILGSIKKYSGWDMRDWSHFAPVAVSFEKFKGDGSISVSQTFQSPWLWNDSSESYINYNDIIGTDSTGKSIPLMSKILPVYFTNETIQPDGDTSRSKFYIWYYITKEFAEKLPERYRTPILKELELITGVEQGLLPREAACEILKGEKSYFGLCASGNGDISNVNVFPIPITDGNITINFTLKTARKIKIELFNANGEFVSRVQDYANYPSGKNSIKTFVEHISSGIYMLSLTDENNQRAIIKILK